MIISIISTGTPLWSLTIFKLFVFIPRSHFIKISSMSNGFKIFLLIARGHGDAHAGEQVCVLRGGQPPEHQLHDIQATVVGDELIIDILA